MEDNSTGSKEVYCTIKKAFPTLTPNSNNQSALKTEPSVVKLTSNVPGTIVAKSSNSKYATVTIDEPSELEPDGENFTKEITINNLAKRETNAYITITLKPTDSNNYYSYSTTYTIGSITEPIAKPNDPTNFCKKDLYYNGSVQTLTTKEGEENYYFYNNTAIEAGEHTVKIKLNNGLKWTDGSTDDITFKCEIKDLTYKVHYLGNGYTTQTYNDSSQCNSEGKCGLNRYLTGSKFNSINGTFEHSANHIYTESWNLITNRFAKTGYHFKGWALRKTGTIKYSDQQTVSNLINPANDTNGTIVELYAKWEANTYTVKYNANGGIGTTSSSSHTYDVSKNLTANNFTRVGYTFEGWATTTTGGKVYTDKQLVTNLTPTNGGTVTLYAKWQANTYTIKYNGNGNTDGSMSDSSLSYDVAQNLTANGFTKTGYVFKEWNTKADGSGTTYANKASVKNLTNPGSTITLYAQWTINKVYVRYSVNGGTITSTTTSDGGTKYTWTTNSSGVISKSSNGGTPTDILNTVNYGASLGSDGLNNWNNSKYINITRSGYTAAANVWKCLSGNCIKTEYNQTTAYTAAELCDASKGSCTITLGVNWTDKDTTPPTCTISSSQTTYSTSKVSVTVKCTDYGSGCATTNQTYTISKDTTYTIKDNAGNATTCTADISTTSSCNSCTVHFCNCYNTDGSGFGDTVNKHKSDAACKDYCYNQNVHALYKYSTVNRTDDCTNCGSTTKYKYVGQK